MRNATLAFLYLLFCSGVSLAQDPVREQSQPEQVSMAKQSDLMGRSGMQTPKAIPSVKLLRFQEIPVGILVDNAVLDQQQTAGPLLSDQQVLEPAARSGEVAVNTSEQATSTPRRGRR